MPCDLCKIGAHPCDLERDRVWVIDRHARLTFFAPTTKGVEEVIGKKVSDLIHPLDVEYMQERLDRLIALHFAGRPIAEAVDIVAPLPKPKEK